MRLELPNVFLTITIRSRFVGFSSRWRCYSVVASFAVFYKMFEKVRSRKLTVAERIHLARIDRRRMK